MKTLLAVMLTVLIAAPLHAQTPSTSNDVILAKIAALEQEIAALKAQLQPAPTPPPAFMDQPQTLAGAAAEAAKVKHEGGALDFRLVGDAPYVPATSTAPTPLIPDAARPVDGKPATTKDESYWKGRMRTLQMQLEADIITGKQVAIRLHSYAGAGPRDRVLERSMLDANDELSRATATVLNDRKAIANLEEEALRAGVPPGWLRYP